MCSEYAVAGKPRGGIGGIAGIDVVLCGERRSCIGRVRRRRRALSSERKTRKRGRCAGMNILWERERYVIGLTRQAGRAISQHLIGRADNRVRDGLGYAVFAGHGGSL